MRWIKPLYHGLGAGRQAAQRCARGGRAPPARPTTQPPTTLPAGSPPPHTPNQLPMCESRARLVTPPPICAGQRLAQPHHPAARIAFSVARPNHEFTGSARSDRCFNSGVDDVYSVHCTSSSLRCCIIYFTFPSRHGWFKHQRSSAQIVHVNYLTEFKPLVINTLLCPHAL